MIASRTICWLAVITLGVAGLSWAVQQAAAPGAAAPTTAAPGAAAPATAAGATYQDAQSAASKDLASAGRRRLELTVGLEGFRMPCLDCHRYLGPATDDPKAKGRGPHKHVVLDHGENNRCFNCHHPSSDKYGSFTAHDGSVIPVETVEQLCGKCHGPHYRAWKRGAHGHRAGYWDPTLGPQSTAHCNECHDPHQPYFKPPPTLPGPRTLHGKLLPDNPCRTKPFHGTPAE